MKGGILIALALLSAVSGCGYRLESGTARFTDPSVRIDVSPFVNRSTTPDAGAVAAAHLREELRRSGFRGSFGNVGANYLIEGKVHEVRRGGVLWKESGLSETASFFSGPDAQYTEANRRAAFEEVARRMAVRLSQTLRILL